MNWDDLKVFLEVARTETLVLASKRLKLDSSTISRRIHKLESLLETQLFDRGVTGHTLTEDGHQLLKTAITIEQQTLSAVEILQGKNLLDKGNIRLGTTDAFGSYFIAPRLIDFFDLHPDITIDMLPLQRLVKLTQHEADLAVTIEKPQNKSLVVSKLSDYRLCMYASKEYLTKHGEISSLNQLSNHQVIGYVDDLLFSNQLSYLNRYLSDIEPVFRSTSVISQFSAVEQGLGVAILPCFLADKSPALVRVLMDDIDLYRSFWIAAPSDRMRLARVSHLWHYLKQQANDNQPLLLGLQNNQSSTALC
ncbi:MAG: LysR family transcriptional regulator [Gammaproteobacteria bacterium]|nr:LysR family transcriptional regulator [Gammaproteobacteria bacterium]